MDGTALNSGTTYVLLVTEPDTSKFGTEFFSYTCSTAPCQTDTTFPNDYGFYLSGPSPGASTSQPGTYEASVCLYSGFSGCATVTFTVGPSITTLLFGSSISAGGYNYDSAALAGVTSTAGGTVTYNQYNDGDCSGTPSTQTVTVTDGAVPHSGVVYFLSGGPYSYDAVYSGDTNNPGPVTSSCEPFNVIASPSISTTVSNSGSIAFGGSATDAAVLTGAYDPTGSVTFTAYSDSSCETQVFTSTDAVVGFSATSGSFTPTAPGTYYWEAAYSGDAYNSGVSSYCGASGETLVVGKETPSVATAFSFAGQSITDTATLSGGYSPSGTVTFYEGFTDGTCSSGGSQVGSPVPLSGDAATSGPLALSAGTHYWDAVYGGDANNNPATSPCEALTLLAPLSDSVGITDTLVPPTPPLLTDSVGITDTLVPPPASSSPETVSFGDVLSTCVYSETQESCGVPVSGGSVSSDQTSVTGVSVSVSGTSGTSATITTQNFGSNQPSGTGTVSLSDSQYYDVQISGISGGTATICIGPSNDANSMEYYDITSNSWVQAGSVTYTDGETCGQVPVDSLTGTYFVIGAPSTVVTTTVESTSTSPGIGVPQFPISIALATAGGFVAVILLRRRLVSSLRLVRQALWK